MSSGGVTTRLQKDMGEMQKELSQLQTDLAQVDVRIDSQLKEFHEEMRSKMKGLFEQYMGLTSTTPSSHFLDKGKGVLGGLPSGFVPKKSLVLSPMQDSGHLGLFSNPSSIESVGRILKFGCLRFDGEDCQSWWSKLE
ncbi:hypothetical protein ES332_D01G180400v1 [Gossypium tomentosum]|uniref:Uncharacterized protein n=1 Tax=Gossypium tomentosum TaxID=34277 RepID=A0A5D2MA93_GOSTO|nr:hypothetical protein ES332_D01G180400v1 [Gossypium tomentosum]